MFNSGLTIGLLLLVVIMLVNVVITLAAPQGEYGIYVPAAILFVAGIIMVALAPLAKVDMFGLGFGGWGAASLFAAAIGLIATSLIETYKHA